MRSFTLALIGAIGFGVAAVGVVRASRRHPAGLIFPKVFGHIEDFTGAWAIWV